MAATSSITPTRLRCEYLENLLWLNGRSRDHSDWLNSDTFFGHDETQRRTMRDGDSTGLAIEASGAGGFVPGTGGIQVRALIVSVVADAGRIPGVTGKRPMADEIRGHG